MNIKQNIFKLPSSTGVYIFKDKQGVVLYVGKANNLKNRVKQYFTGHDTRPKIKYLVPIIKDIQTIEVDSEFEALLLEAALIKKHLPKFNSAAKDDKHPLYIAVTKEEFPKIRTVRRNQDIGSADLFGPFPSAHTVKQVLKFIRRIFPYCSCKSNQGRPCLYASIGLCKPCPRSIISGSPSLPKMKTSSPPFEGGAGGGRLEEANRAQKQYRKQIALLKKLLSGQAPQVLKTLEREMNKAAKNKDYETAAYYRDGLQNLQHLLQPNRPINNYLDNPNLRLEIRQESLRQLQIILNTQNITPPIKQLNRIECYDISTLSGTFSTGSLVVFTQGQPDKSQYRRFKIKKEGKPNDIAMITEMLSRRLKRYLSPNQLQNSWPIPDLLVIDGGQPQLSAVLNVLKKYHLTVPAISLAKRLEEIYIPTEPKSPTTKLLLPKSNPSLQLLQHLRDEAHRFANAYRKTITKSSNFRNA